ncbi:MAG: hypothetical protein R2704_06485 [Microthrixaceae bacterium]
MTTRLGNASTARRRTSMTSLIGLLSVMALVAGCACSAASPAVHTDPTVAAIRHVIAQDNTFGGGGNPFSRVVVDPKRADGTSLSAATKAAIVSELADLGDVEVSTSKVLDGEASIQVGAVVTTPTGVDIKVNMYCGNVCGLFATFTLVQWPGGGWTVTGTRGPIAVA